MPIAKPADTAHPIHPLLRERWSPRAFAKKAVERDKLLSLLEAGRWAASCANEQSWAFLVATADDHAGFATMLGCLTAGNQVWCAHAPVLMLSLARTHFAARGVPNRHYMHDVGQFAANMAIQAVAHGLVIHQMAGIVPDAIRSTYAVPEGYEPCTAIAIGYHGELADLPNDEQRTREQTPRVRKPLGDFVFAGKFGEKSPLVG